MHEGTKIDWSKAPELATHCTPKRRHETNRMPVFWRVVNGVVVEAWSMSDDYSEIKRHIIYGEIECIGFDLGYAVARPALWTGTGLPLAGTVCEYDAAVDSEPPLWHTVEIVYASEWLVVVRCLKSPSGREDSVGVEYAVDATEEAMKWFRPIRTIEQIAAEEREKAVEQMMEDYKYKEGPCTHYLIRSQAERIYDVGYRKAKGEA